MSSDEVIGKVEFIVGAQTFQTGYVIYGDLKSGKRPLVGLHGGPGLTHHYMTPHKEITKVTGHPVVLYDQLGNGSSSLYQDAPKEFWNAELFSDELENLLKALGIFDDFDLLGHSWGGMLAAQYAALRKPKGLKHLVFANSAASGALIADGTKELLKGFSPEFVATLQKHQEGGTTDSEEYKAHYMQYFAKHIYTLNEWPADLLASLKASGENPAVRRTMLGPSECYITGYLKTWTIVDQVHKIECPVLVISSTGDAIQPSASAPFRAIPNTKAVELSSSTHLPMWEEPERYFEVVSDFLTDK